MSEKQNKYDTAIIGGGLAGLTMACLLGRAGIATLCLDQAPPGISADPDLRTTAISYGSRRILEEAGIWSNITESCAIEDIRILDGSSPVLLNFLSDEVEGKAFGWIVLNVDLRAAMMKTLKALRSVRHVAGAKVTDFKIDRDRAQIHLADGKTFETKLVIGADGRNSFTREWMGVRTRQWSYRQRAVICTVSHTNPHHNIAVEHFWPEGPFAILPMADGPGGQHRSSVVFTEHGPESKSLMRFTDTEFETALAARFPAEYGEVRLIGRRAAYPLALVHAASYIAPRMALVADAAHGIHPIAGQGLNLGFRDIKALADLLREAHTAARDPGAAELLETYQRRRRFDNMTMVAVTDGLVRLFSNSVPPVRILRKMGLKAVSRLPAAKRFFMRRAMGE